MNAACSRTQNLLPQAVLCELDEALRAELLAHAKECAECDAALAFQENLQEAIDAAPSAAPPPVYFESVLAEVHRRMPSCPPRAHREKRGFRIRREWSATAAMACLALMVMPGIFSSSDSAKNERALRGSAAWTASASPLGSPGVSVAEPGRSMQFAPRVQVAMLWIPEVGFISAASGLLELGPEGLAELGLSRPVLISDSFMLRWRG